jgi:hypothetical protein
LVDSTLGGTEIGIMARICKNPFTATKSPSIEELREAQSLSLGQQG